MIQLGNAVFDPDAHLLRDPAGGKLALRAQTLRVLECLIAANGDMVSKESLVQTVWGKVAVTDDSLVQCVGEIRSAIGDGAHEILQTEHRRGYRLVTAAKPGIRAAWPEPVTKRTEARQNQTETQGGGQNFAAPAIAVMAFSSMAGDERSERLAMTFAGDLSAELARHRELRVISRLSSFALKGQVLGTKEICQRLNARFIVSGQVQFSESAVEWSLEMVDGQSDEIAWSERRRVDFLNMYEETAALIGRMAGMIDNCFRLHIIWKAPAKAPDSLGAYDLVSRADALLMLNSVEGARQGQALAALAVQRHPDYARAWRILAHTHSFDMHSCHTGEWKENRVGEALAEIRRAIELDSTSPNAHAVLANLLSVDGQLDEALIASDRALAFVEGDPMVLHLRAVILLHAGRFEEALQNMLACRAVVPIPRGTHLEILGRILLGMGEIEKAIDALRHAATVAPGSIARMSLVVALQENGQRELAAQHFKILLTHTNGFDEGYFGKRYAAIPQFRARYLKALRVHGLQRAKEVADKDTKVPLTLVKLA